MNKLILASVITEEILSKLTDLVGKTASDIKVVFITTASTPEKDVEYMTDDENLWKRMGFTLNYYDLESKNRGELLEFFEGNDVIYLAGGNTFYLLEKIKESGFDLIIEQLLNQGIVLVGSSAGAIVACPDIEPIKYADFPELARKLDNCKAMGLVDFLIFPHYNDLDFKPLLEKGIEDCKKSGMKYKVLNDGESFIMEDKKIIKI